MGRVLFSFLWPVGILLTTSASRAGAQTVQLPDTVAGVAYGELAGARVRVRYGPEDAPLAKRVLDLLEAEPRLPGLPDSLPTGVTAYLAHSPEAFDALTGGRVPEWRAGVALPELGLMVLPTGEGRGLLDPEGRRVLRHEWAHLGLSQTLQGLRPPRWFDEGYAQWASGGFDATEGWRLRVLLALGRTPPLDSLTLAWPRDRPSADAAYLLAASAVTYLLGSSGERGLELFFDRWKAQRSFEAGLRETFGVTTSQFEEDWRRHVRRQYGWLFVLSHSVVFWMALALVLLAMVRIRKTRNRERMARLRAREVPDQPAFWAPESDEGGPGAPPGVD